MHLGFLEGRGPNFEIGAKVQARSYRYCTNRKKKTKHNPIYFLISSLPQKFNTSEYKLMHPFSESSFFIGLRLSQIAGDTKIQNCCFFTAKSKPFKWAVLENKGEQSKNFSEAYFVERRKMFY